MITTTSQDFSKHWYTTTSGSGAVTHPGYKVVRTVGSVNNAAYVAYETMAFPGEIIVFTVYGRMLAMSGGFYPRVFLDAPNGFNRCRIDVDSPDWQLYKVSYQIPLTEVNPILIKVGVGSYSSIGGSAEFVRPQLEVRNEAVGASRVIASGCITVASGGSSVTMNSSYKYHGFGTLGYTAANKQIDMSLNGVYDFSSSLQTSRPNIYLQSFSDGDTTDGLLIWKPTSILDTGAFKIEAFLSTTGAKYNFAASTVPHYCFVEVKI